MEITEIRVFLKEGQDKKLKAYATVTFDQVFVVRNIKVIQGANGLFIAMPSRKLKYSCAQCGFKNEVGRRFCCQCAAGLPEKLDVEALEHDAKSEHREHRDIAHPVTQQFREYLQTKILTAYESEVEKSPAAAR